MRDLLAHGAQNLTGNSGEHLLLTLLAMQKPPSESMIAIARMTITRLTERLGLDLAQVAAILGVSSEQVVDWISGAVPPAFAIAELHTLDAALSTLEHLFEPTRIAQIIRRPAELFDGESALELILRGELTSVAAKYDESLHYAR